MNAGNLGNHAAAATKNLRRPSLFRQITVETGLPINSVIFKITHVAVQLAREIERSERLAKEPRDIVAKANESVRKHWLLALAVIGFFVLTAAVTFANQLVQLLQNLGWMAKQ